MPIIEKLWEAIDPDLAQTVTFSPTEYYNKKNLQIITSNIYLFKANNRNTRTSCEICSKLTLNIFHTLLWRFYC